MRFGHTARCSHSILHDHPFKLGYPDVLRLVGDSVSGTGVVHRITYSFSYFFYLLFYLLILFFIYTYKTACCIKLND